MDVNLSLTDPSDRCIWEGCVTLLSRSKSRRSRETRRFGESGRFCVPQADNVSRITFATSSFKTVM